MSEQTNSCPQCGGDVPADATSGLCPKCLLQLGFDSVPKAEAATGAYQPTFLAPTAEHLAPYFPDYEILELIGHGGMGVVYKAKQRELDRLVALKILRPDIEKDPSFAERFQREARTLAQLNHPNIITIHNFGRKDDLYFLVMEYVDGTNLRQLERAAQLKPAEALMIVPKICEALQYAHEQGVVHRDIKPENILVTQEGRVKIADFGLAKLSGVSDQFSLTGTWQIMGTPHYMAPEQFERPTEVDHRADIFSLGVVIYEMLTGELPLGRFPLPSEKTAGDKRLDDVVERALHKEPESRYQQVSEVKTAVEDISSTPEQQRPKSSKKRYGSVLYEKLTGKQIEEEESPELSPEESRNRILKRLRQGTFHLFYLSLLNFVLAVIMLPFQGVNLLFVFGFVTGPALFVLRHLVLSRQNLQLAQWLTVVASLPVSVLCAANWIVLFLFSHLSLLWKPDLVADFEDVPWKETEAARKCSAFFSTLRAMWQSFISLFVTLWNEKSRVLDAVLWLFGFLLRKLLAIFPLLFGVALWSALWGATAFIGDEYWMERYAPAEYDIRDTTAGTLVPHSGAYEGFKVTAYESGVTYGKKIPEENRGRTHLKLELIPHPDSRRPRQRSYEFYLNESSSPAENRVEVWRENELLTKRFLENWLAESGIRSNDSIVQSELQHLDQQIHKFLETGGIERGPDDQISFPPVNSFFDESIFTAKERGYVTNSIRTVRDVKVALSMFCFVTWFIGTLLITTALIAFWISKKSKTGQHPQRALKWCSRGFIAYSIVSFLTLLFLDWLLFRSGRPLNFLPDYAFINDTIRFAIEGFLVTCLVVTLFAGLTLSKVHISAMRWLGIVAAILVMIIPPWCLFAFPLGFITFCIVRQSAPRQLEESVSEGQNLA